MKLFRPDRSECLASSRGVANAALLIRRYTLALSACCVIAGCAVSHPTTIFVPFTLQKYHLTETVEVLYNKPPGRPYVELGELSIRLSN
ncbi:MAG TPA: hypothetical protein VN966_00260, partial [Candidatus Bathyarchaeia archaeon]|nr:hypothetical protein [Candidatus Bathyarchaeia archaeon]